MGFSKKEHPVELNITFVELLPIICWKMKRQDLCSELAEMELAEACDWLFDLMD